MTKVAAARLAVLLGLDANAVRCWTVAQRQSAIASLEAPACGCKPTRTKRTILVPRGLDAPKRHTETVLDYSDCPHGWAAPDSGLTRLELIEVLRILDPIGYRDPGVRPRGKNVLSRDGLVELYRARANRGEALYDGDDLGQRVVEEDRFSRRIDPSALAANGRIISAAIVICEVEAMPEEEEEDQRYENAADRFARRLTKGTP